MPGRAELRRLLEDMRGGGFRVNIAFSGVELIAQKVVAVDQELVYTVDAAGNVRATRIDQIQSVNY